MSNDTASLVMRVQSLEVEVANNRLKNLQKNAGGAEKASDGLTNSFKGMIAPLVALVGVTSTLTKLVGTGREFDVLNAQLITATGSAEGAAVAFEALQEFAAKTPYDLAQVTTSFTKLVNLGLTPSERALTSYGNTASAMGKNLNQMIEAVADASTMEFERLKEFGIKTRQQADTVSFTFRGVTTTVKKNAEEIEGYLMALGENEFAGAMEQRANSLDGAISNLGDTWDQVFMNISNAGVGDFIEEQVRSATETLQELNDMILSGQLLGYLDALKIKFEGYTTDINNLFKTVQELMGDSRGIVDFMTEAFRNLPENVRFFIQAMVIEILAGFDKVQTYAGAFLDSINALFTDDTQEEVIKRLNDNLTEINEIRQSSLQDIANERDASIAASEAQIKASEKLRQEYDKLQESKKKATGGKDRLAEFTNQKDKENVVVEDPKIIIQQQKQLEKVREYLRSEEESILESYMKRREIILKNTEENSTAQVNLLNSLKEKFAEESLGDFKPEDNYEEQLAALQEYYNKRHELILSNTDLTEAERTALEEKLTKGRNQKIEALEKKRMSLILSNSAELFDGLASVAGEFAGKQSGIFKALFVASKAFAIADSIIKIQQGIANASSLPFPSNLGAMATVASSTAGLLTTIKGTEIQGIAHGGMDNIPEEATYLLNKGERVLSPNQNKELTDFMRGDRSGGLSSVKVEVINQTGMSMNVSAEIIDEATIRLFVDAADRKFRQDLHDGRGMWSEAKQKFGLSTRGNI